MRGIDYRPSRMLSKSSTTWATLPHNVKHDRMTLHNVTKMVSNQLKM